MKPTTLLLTALILFVAAACRPAASPLPALQGPALLYFYTDN